MANEAAGLRKRAADLERALDRYAESVDDLMKRSDRALDREDYEELTDIEMLLMDEIRKRHDEVSKEWGAMTKHLSQMSKILSRIDKDTMSRLKRQERDAKR